MPEEIPGGAPPQETVSLGRRAFAKLVVYLAAFLGMAVVFAPVLFLAPDSLERSADPSLTDMTFVMEVLGWACMMAYWAVGLSLRIFHFHWMKSGQWFWSRNVGIGIQGLTALATLLAGLSFMLEQGKVGIAIVHFVVAAGLLIHALIRNRRFKKEYGL